MPLSTRTPRRERAKYIARVGEDPDQPVEVMRRAWRRGERPVARPALFELAAGVGAYERNTRPDVAGIEQALSLTGDYDLAPTEGPTGLFSDAKSRAIVTFQERNGLRPDGQIRPGGPTVRTLRKQLVSTSPTRDIVPTRERGAAGDATGGRRKGDGEVQVAFAPAIVAGAAAVAPYVGSALGAASGALVGTLLGTWLFGGKSDETREEPGAEARHREALRERSVDVMLGPLARPKPMEDRRGNDRTKQGNDIAIEVCLEVLKEEFPDLAGRVEHEWGGTQDGKGEETLKELYIPNPDNPDNPRLGSSYPDFAFRVDGDDKRRIHVNTTDTLKDGTTPNARERFQLEKLRRRVGDRLVAAMPKLGPDDDEAKYADTVRDICRTILDIAREEFANDKEE